VRRGRARSQYRATVPRAAWTVLLATAVVALAAPAALGDEPACLTYVAPDGHEPPCNPALADSPWSASHRAGFAQASSPFAGPAPGQAIVASHTELGVVPIVIDFTPRYADGGRDAWASTVGAPDNGTIVKLDVATGETIDTYSLPADEQKGPAGIGSISGAYNLLDRDNHLIVGRATALEVYGDAAVGDRRSPIALLRRFALPARALCRSTDALVGINMLPDGHIAFATANGMVGTVPRQPDLMDDAHLRVFSINGARCADGSVADDALENVSNSIAVDERGAIYTVTDTAQYKHVLGVAGVEQVWRATYETGAGTGVRLGDGSGSTPTVMGTDAGDDRFIVITDGQKLMHLVLMWGDEIPPGWQPIAPGKDRRIACEVPVRFGDPNATESVDEQSVLVRGYASILVNNALRNSSFLDSLPAQLRTVAAALAGGDPTRAPHGLERIDWDPATRTCKSVWANREVSVPNGIPSMSAATKLVYGIGQRDGTWGLEGLDFATGASRLWVPTTPLPYENSFYAATEIGPDGAIWTGTFGGVTIFRPPVAAAPAKVCKDITKPEVAIARPRAGTRRVRGSADDMACAAPATAPRVEVAVSRRGSRSALRWQRARGGARWQLRLRQRLSGGDEVRARATDAAGNTTTVKTDVRRAARRR
jgi:hypothetical protein